jgi:PHD/YefM family antitoxin component YafN of YafNO toxin-antitoxin module
MRRRQSERVVLLSDRERGLLVRAAFKRLMRPPSRNDHIHLVSSPENARRLMEAYNDAVAGRGRRMTLAKLRAEVGVRAA